MSRFLFWKTYLPEHRIFGFYNLPDIYLSLGCDGCAGLLRRLQRWLCTVAIPALVGCGNCEGGLDGCDNGIGWLQRPMLIWWTWFLQDSFVKLWCLARSLIQPKKLRHSMASSFLPIAICRSCRIFGCRHWTPASVQWILYERHTRSDHCPSCAFLEWSLKTRFHH
jgi:hypothetical protein